MSKSVSGYFKTKKRGKKLSTKLRGRGGGLKALVVSLSTKKNNFFAAIVHRTLGAC